MKAELGCDYQGYEFGARYLDSVCIRGYLWDADSGSNPRELSSGGDIPCPQCNHEAWIAHHQEDIEEQGATAFDEGKKITDCDFLDKEIKLVYEADRELYIGFWQDGWRIAEAEKVSQGTTV